MAQGVSATKHRRVIVKKEPTVKKGEYVDHSVLWTLDNSVKGWDSVTLQLYASGKGATSDPTAGSGAEHVGDLKVNLKGVNWGEIPRTTAPDNRSLLYQFDATLRVGIAGESGLWTFKLLRDGEEVGTAHFKTR